MILPNNTNLQFLSTFLLFCVDYQYILYSMRRNRKAKAMTHIWEMDCHERNGFVMSALFHIDASYEVIEDYWEIDFIHTVMPDGTHHRIDDEPEYQWVIPLAQEWLNNSDKAIDAAAEIIWEGKQNAYAN